VRTLRKTVVMCACVLMFGMLGPLTARTAPQEAPAAGQAAGQGRQGGPAAPDNRVLGPNGEMWGNRGLPPVLGTPWTIHDAERPQPPVVTPGEALGTPPSDAIVLFDGSDLSAFAHRQNGQLVDATWPVRDGYFETGAGTGSIVTRESFGDVQLHLEFATPAAVSGSSQGRGNSGVIFMGLYEVQVLDSYQNRTYADGMAASIYGEWPPLVNAARPPGAWQTYDIVFEAPRFSGDVLVAPAYATVFWNGVLVHNRKQILGPTSPTQTVHSYRPHEAELPLTLQDHSNPVRYRNVWIRRLAGYDMGSAR